MTRTIPAELASRYQAEGWWTADTMGGILARGLAAAPGTRFQVHSADLGELSSIVGVERVLFGSDYPHPEGLAEPARYIDVLNERTKLTDEEKAKIMGGNLARLMAA